MKPKKKLLVGCGGLLAVGVVVFAGYAAYAFATVDDGLMFPDAPGPVIAASADPAVIERGRYLFHGPAHCTQCHGTSDRAHPEKNTGDVVPSGGLVFEVGPIATTWAANLTSDEETGIGARTDAQLARTIRTGVLPNGFLSIFMRFSAAKLAEDDLVAVISYLRSVAPAKNAVPAASWGTVGTLLLPVMPMVMPIGPGATMGPVGVPAADEPSVDRGRYLAESVMLCTACHAKFDPSTFESTGPKAGGGDAQPIPELDGMEFATPNLTSHATGVTGKVTEDEFLQRLRAPRVYAWSIMPWENFSRATDADLRSVYRYLRSLPPVDNDVGPSFRKTGTWPGGA